MLTLALCKTASLGEAGGLRVGHASGMLALLCTLHQQTTLWETEIGL